MTDPSLPPTETDSTAATRTWTRPTVRAALAAALGIGTWVALGALGLPALTARMGAVAALMAVLWVTEAMPIPVTSLLPLVLFPALGIETLGSTAACYGKPVIFLFLGGFLLALGLQRSRLHRRIALGIVHAIGSQPRRLVLGFMLASASMSMWISNTASVMVMMPIGLALLEEARGRGMETSAHATLGTTLMLGIAYAANIGGMATLVGTPANLVYAELQEQLLPAGDRISFAGWMALGLPVALVFLSVGWYLLVFRTFRLGPEAVFGESDAVSRARAALGEVRRDEVVAGLAFAAAAGLWITGSDVAVGDAFVVRGWRGALGLEEVGDGAVAIACAVPLFLVPSSDRSGEAVMDWQTARTMPWGLLLLFGGGFALAAGFESSGLSAAIGRAFTGLQGAPPLLVIATVCAVVTFMTELTSNTAITTLALPILAEAAHGLHLDPRALMIPATLSASCAFMMPVASPTQAIVFGTDYVSIRQMVRAGIRFNLFGVVLVTTLVYLIGEAMLGISLEPLP